MAQWWVKVVGSPVGRALAWKPSTWRGLLVSNVGLLVGVLLVEDLLGWYDLRRDPAPGLLFAVCMIGAQIFAFGRARRLDGRDAERRDTKARADRSTAG
jgi:hypothetical protein